jgi:hypothetical protein
MSNCTCKSAYTKKGVRDARARLMRAGTIAAVAVALSAMVACDSLLEVEVPGHITESELNDPRLAAELVLSAEASFDCMMSTYLEEIGRWAKDFYYMNTGTGFIYTQLRTREVEDFEQVDCRQTGPTRSAAVWLPLNTARAQGEQALEIVGEFSDETVDHRSFLLAKAHAYTGYTYQIAGETLCELAFDGGPMVTRQVAWGIAEQHFTDALQFASQATSAPSGEDVGSIRDMALVGRARARLHLGDTQGVVEDASQVDLGFVRYVQTDEITGRRYNRVYENNNLDIGTSVHPSYHNLEVQGVPDPRVPLEQLGVIAFDAVTDVHTQQKYLSLGADILFSTGREAQLMIAEVQGGQTAVNIINTLRATVEDLPWVTGDHDLPVFVSADPDEILAQVLEERRRELWLQGTKLGDMLRVMERADLPMIEGLEFETGLNQRGQAYGFGTCYPLPLAEKDNNPNF